MPSRLLSALCNVCYWDELAVYDPLPNGKNALFESLQKRFLPICALMQLHDAPGCRIDPAVLQQVQQDYDNANPTEPNLQDFAPGIERQRVHKLEHALEARKHMIPHNLDRLAIQRRGYDAKADFLANKLLITIFPTDFMGHLEGLKRTVSFVVITTKEHDCDDQEETALPYLSYTNMEVFWVAGQSPDGKYFVAKSQDKLVQQADVQWTVSPWGLVSKWDCLVVMLDMEEGAWIMCDLRSSSDPADQSSEG